MAAPLPIYLDSHATTPVDPRVFEAMRPYFCEKFGNAASSQHRFGWVAEEAVEMARERVANAIRARKSEIVFTSGATESNNLAIKGLLWAAKDRGDQVITVATEHRSVLDPIRRLAREGYRTTIVGVQRSGLVDVDELARAIGPKTVLVSVMAANNEIGVLQPLSAIGNLCRDRGVFFHTDAAQAVGKIPLDVDAMHIDLLSISGHKVYGPKGVGALYVRRKNPSVVLAPLLDGGGHERGLRSGTLNVPGIVGLGEAVAIAEVEMPAERERLLKLRTRLLEGLRQELDSVELNGHETERLPGNLHVSFRWVDGEALMAAMRDVAVSSSAACTSASREPSHVLVALGLDPVRAHSSIRFGLGRFTTDEDIERTIRSVVHAVTKLREASPAYFEAKLAKGGIP